MPANKTDLLTEKKEEKLRSLLLLGAVPSREDAWRRTSPGAKRRDWPRARSDWIEKNFEQPGRQLRLRAPVFDDLEHDGVVSNLLDTPGHQDFQREDNYRTLTAVDSGP